MILQHDIHVEYKNTWYNIEITRNWSDTWTYEILSLLNSFFFAWSFLFEAVFTCCLNDHKDIWIISWYLKNVHVGHTFHNLAIIDLIRLECLLFWLIFTIQYYMCLHYCFRALNGNIITTVQSGAFKDLPALNHMYVFNCNRLFSIQKNIQYMSTWQNWCIDVPQDSKMALKLFVIILIKNRIIKFKTWKNSQ